MGNVYREMRQGATKIADGTRLIYCLKCMRDVIETIAVERIEDRLGQLEGASGHAGTTRLISERIDVLAIGGGLDRDEPSAPGEP